MKVESVDTRQLEERMNIASRAREAIAEAQAPAGREAQAQAAQTVRTAVRPAQAGAPFELSEKGRIVRTVA
jgi:hypothetical protein